MIVIVSNQHHIIGSLIVCIILYINILVHDKPHSVKKSDHIPYSKANHRFQVCPDPCTAVTTPPNAVRMSVQRCTYNVTNHCALKNNNKQACLGGWTIIALLDRDELDYSQAAVGSDNFGGLVKTGRGGGVVGPEPWWGARRGEHFSMIFHGKALSCGQLRKKVRLFSYNMRIRFKKSYMVVWECFHLLHLFLFMSLLCFYVFVSLCHVIFIFILFMS